MGSSGIIHFLTHGIWRLRERDLSGRKWFLVRVLRVVVLAFRGFAEDKCHLRASSLTFYSLLSIVPVVAMGFGIAKGFGFERALENLLVTKLEGQQEVITRVISFAHALLENTKGGIIAGIGVIILLWTIIKVLTNIENSFNEIWGVKRGRSFGRKISDYLSLMFICPLLLVLSSAATVVIASEVKLIISKINLLGPISPLIFFLLKFLPYCVIWVLFTFMYVFMPNTKVTFKSGLIAGVLAGTLYQLFQFVYIHFQVGVAQYNAIYGSFAALPLFLIWLQVSWIVVLSGAELSFAHQNVDTYEFEPDCLAVSPSFKRLLSLRITHLLVENFSVGKDPLSETEISHDLEIPIRLVRQILFELMISGVISRIDLDGDRRIGYQPAVAINRISVKFVMDSLDNYGTDDIPVRDSKELEKLSDTLRTFSDIIEKSQENKPLKEL